MAEAGREQFGEPRLSHAEVSPRSADQRTVPPAALAALWLAPVAAPAVLGALAGAGLDGRAVATLGAALVGLAAMAVLLARPALRYGIGPTAQGRAALGGRGGSLLGWLRAAAGIAWGALFAAELSRWTAALLRVAFDIPAGSAIGVVAPLALALLLVGAAYLVARGRLRGCARVASQAALSLALLVGALLLVAVVQAGGAEPLLAALERGGGAGGETLPVVLAALPAVVAAAELGRTMRSPRRPGAAGAAGAGLVIVAGALLAALGATVAAAGLAVHGELDGSFVPNGGRAGGVVGAGLAAAISLVLWLMAAPLVALHAPAVALLGAWPYPSRHRSALSAVTLAVLATTGAALVWPEHAGPSLTLPLALLAPAATLLVVDELRRRGKVYLEELYLPGGVYGPMLGFSLAGVCALVFGAAIVAGVWLAPGQLGELVGARVDRAAGLALACVATLVVYGGLAGVDAGLRRARKGEAHTSRRLLRRGTGAAPLVADPSTTQALADARFVRRGTRRRGDEQD